MRCSRDQPQPGKITHPSFRCAGHPGGWQRRDSCPSPAPSDHESPRGCHSPSWRGDCLTRDGGSSKTLWPKLQCLGRHRGSLLIPHGGTKSLWKSLDDHQLEVLRWRTSGTSLLTKRCCPQTSVRASAPDVPLKHLDHLNCQTPPATCTPPQPDQSCFP